MIALMENKSKTRQRKKSLSITLDENLVSLIEDRADKERRNVSNMINVMLLEYLELTSEGL